MLGRTGPVRQWLKITLNTLEPHIIQMYKTGKDLELHFFMIKYFFKCKNILQADIYTECGLLHFRSDVLLGFKENNVRYTVF